MKNVKKYFRNFVVAVIVGVLLWNVLLYSAKIVENHNTEIIEKVIEFIK